MCGAYVVRHNPGLRGILGIETPEDMKQAEQDSKPEKFRPGDIPDIFASKDKPQTVRPTQWVPIIAENKEGLCEFHRAKWWLIMQSSDEGWKPNQKLASFNSKISKVLDTGRTTHNMKPRSFRVLVPAVGWLEWYAKKPYFFTRTDGHTILFGGMAKAWPLPDGEFMLSASIITLPGHEATRHIHEKSLPLIVPPEEQQQWLDREVPNQAFEQYLTPRIWTPLSIQRVKDANSLTPDGEPELIDTDAA